MLCHLIKGFSWLVEELFSPFQQSKITSALNLSLPFHIPWLSYFFTSVQVSVLAYGEAQLNYKKTIPTTGSSFQLKEYAQQRLDCDRGMHTPRCLTVHTKPADIMVVLLASDATTSMPSLYSPCLILVRWRGASRPDGQMSPPTVRMWSLYQRLDMALAWLVSPHPTG